MEIRGWNCKRLITRLAFPENLEIIMFSCNRPYLMRLLHPQGEIIKPLSFINSLYDAPSVMRNISATVLIVFNMLILTLVLVVAALMEREEIGLHQGAQSDIQKIQDLKQQLFILDKKVQANFEQIEIELLDRQLPQAILDRHQHSAEIYRKEISLLLTELKAIATTNSDKDQQSRAEKLSAITD